MILTPWVFLPIFAMSLTWILITIPFFDATMISSSSLTALIATTWPFLSVVWMLITPLPPLLINLYSGMSVRLPKPFSVIVNNWPLSIATSIPITSSPLPRVIPLTP